MRGEPSPTPRAYLDIVVPSGEVWSLPVLRRWDFGVGSLSKLTGLGGVGRIDLLGKLTRGVSEVRVSSLDHIERGSYTLPEGKYGAVAGLDRSTNTFV
jgi:hypothetical protein